MPKIVLKNVVETATYVRRYQRGLARMSNVRAWIGSRLPYAYGIHEGRHRRGRLARGAGGTRYLRKAVDSVLSQADYDISQGMEKVRYPGPWIVKRVGRWARRVSKTMTIIRSGALKRSITVIFEDKNQTGAR